MSIETAQRGEEKRNEIRRIFYGLLCESLYSKQKKTESEAIVIVGKHAGIMMKKNPRENHLVISVLTEIKSNPKNFMVQENMKERRRKHG